MMSTGSGSAVWPTHWPSPTPVYEPRPGYTGPYWPVPDWVRPVWMR